MTVALSAVCAPTACSSLLSNIYCAPRSYCWLFRSISGGAVIFEVCKPLKTDIMSPATTTTIPPFPSCALLQESFLRIGDEFRGQLNTLRRYLPPPRCFYSSLPTGAVSSTTTCLKNLLLSEQVCFHSHDERNGWGALKLLPQPTHFPVCRASLDPAERRPTPLNSCQSSVLNFHFLRLALQCGS